MQITKRQKEIMDLLKSHEYMTAENIAKKLQVSEKTVRLDISKINGRGDGTLIQSGKGKGYSLNQTEVSAPSFIMPDTGEQRQKLILLYFISNPKTDFYELADEFFISESTLEKDIVSINQKIKIRFPRTSVRRKSNQLYMGGDEEDVRNLLVYYLLKELEEYHFNFLSIIGYFHFCDLEELKRFVLNLLKRENMALEDADIITLILYSGVTAERVARGYVVNSEAQTENGGWDKACDILCEELENGIGKELPTAERNRIQLFLNLRRGAVSESADEKREYECFIDETLRGIYNKYNIDFREDKVFTEKLAMHLKELRHRACTYQFEDNPLVHDIKNTYPLIYDISVYLGMRIQERYGIWITEDEIGYLSLHMVSCMDGRGMRKKRIAIINPGNSALSRFIGNTLKRYFHNSVEISGSYSLFQIERLKEENPDLIVTTTPLSQTFSCPVFQVSNLISAQELEKIRKLLTSREFGRMEERLGLLYQFDSRLFFPLLQFSKREEVIRFLCGKLEEEGYCDDKYVDYVMEREEISATSFGNYVAIPHPVEMAARKNGIAVATLNNDIAWGENKVRVVFLFSLASSSLNLTLFYDILAKSLDDVGKMKHIIRHTEFNKFMEAFLN